ncbi:BQ5605_C003g02124 [Microbotryum silenes-dioicae]|uniref:BQ5605_C003g02124 protein n=1 Tax=Microbotryum silenes-dioicae TaxID=796604 RepID=A0A2X0M4B1_9BASI|nr:BQ5605_C003g02124 [Microbotryum silenes-dioicae]
MNMTIAELLAFDVAPADASLHIELSKDELTHYSTLSSTRGPTSSCSTQGRPMEATDPTRGEAGARSMGPSRYEDMAGTTRSFCWTGGDQMARALTTHEDPEEYGALAQRYPHFGMLDGGAVTTTTTSEIGSLVCFGLKRGMHSLSCDQTAYGEEALSIGIGLVCYSAIHLQQSDNSALASLVVLSNIVVQELRLIKKACSSIHLVDGTMPFRMIDGRQVIESLGPPKITYSSTTYLTSLYPDERIISTSAHAEQSFASLRSVPGLRDAAGRTSTSHKCHGGYKKLKFSKPILTMKQRASQQSKEGLFEAWSHAQHQPKRRAPQATFDRPRRARKRSERVFEDF